jgi:hypothetical protein
VEAHHHAAVHKVDQKAAPVKAAAEAAVPDKNTGVL